MIHFTSSVGVAPGTTTMQMNGLGCVGCHLGAGAQKIQVIKEVRTMPTTSLYGLGVCPPGYYGERIMLPSAVNFGPAAAAYTPPVPASAGTPEVVIPPAAMKLAPGTLVPITEVDRAGQAERAMRSRRAESLNPYATESKLRGLLGLGGVRWDLLALTFGLGFAGVLGYSVLRKRKRR